MRDTRIEPVGVAVELVNGGFLPLPPTSGCQPEDDSAALRPSPGSAVQEPLVVEDHPAVRPSAIISIHEQMDYLLPPGARSLCCRLELEHRPATAAVTNALLIAPIRRSAVDCTFAVQDQTSVRDGAVRAAREAV